MFHIYTYGTQSVQFLIMTQKQADLVNEFTDKFTYAQKQFFKTYGRHWTPDEPLLMDERYVAGNLKKYNKLTRLLNAQHAIRNRVFSVLRIDVSKEPVDAYLVKRR